MQPPSTPTKGDHLYDPAYQRALFDGMRATYERMSTISSFGFNRRWRAQLAAQLDLRPGQVLGDLMSGGGEAWRHLLPLLGDAARWGRLRGCRSRCQWDRWCCQATLPQVK